MYRIAKLFSVFAFVIIALLTCGYFYQLIMESGDFRRLQPPGELVQIDGRNLYLECSGVGSPVVIFEEGAGASSLASRNVRNEVEKLTRVCGYDRAGFGWSELAEGNRSFDDLVSDLHELMHSEEIKSPYILVGSSFGGLVARTYQRQFPEQIAGMILLDSAEEKITFDNFEYMKATNESIFAHRWLTAMFGIERLAMQFSPPDLGPAYPKEVLPELFTQWSRTANYKALTQQLSPIDLEIENWQNGATQGELGSLPLVVIYQDTALHPTVIPGVSGETWSEAQRRLAALSSDSQILIAQGSSHNILNDRPDVVVEAIREMVARTKNSGVSIEKQN